MPETEPMPGPTIPIAMTPESMTPDMLSHIDLSAFTTPDTPEAPTDEPATLESTTASPEDAHALNVQRLGSLVLASEIEASFDGAHSALYREDADGDLVPSNRHTYTVDADGKRHVITRAEALSKADELIALREEGAKAETPHAYDLTRMSSEDLATVTGKSKAEIFKDKAGVINEYLGISQKKEYETPEEKEAAEAKQAAIRLEMEAKEATSAVMSVRSEREASAFLESKVNTMLNAALMRGQISEGRMLGMMDAMRQYQSAPNPEARNQHMQFLLNEIAAISLQERTPDVVPFEARKGRGRGNPRDTKGKRAA